jgi:hypothetical protein
MLFVAAALVPAQLPGTEFSSTPTTLSSKTRSVLDELGDMYAHWVSATPTGSRLARPRLSVC